MRGIFVLLVICAICPTPAFIAFTATIIASYAIFRLAKWLCGAASRFLKAIKAKVGSARFLFGVAIGLYPRADAEVYPLLTLETNAP